MSHTPEPRSEPDVMTEQTPCSVEDCPVACRWCGKPMDDCGTDDDNPPWCCDYCHHCVSCSEHTEACHAV